MEGNAANVCRTVAVSGTDGDNHLAMATAENVVSCGVQPNIANEAILSKPSEGHIGNVTNEQSGNAQYEQLENTTNEQTVNNQADCYGNAQVEQSGTPHDDYHKEPLVAMGNAFADYAAQRNAEKSAGTRWTVAAHTDGTFGSTQSESHPLLAAAYESMGSDGTCYFVNSNQLLQASRYKEIKHHAQPVSFGLSVGYAFTDRLSLNSGLVYTRAESELSNVSGNDEIVSKQRLHYVGVPLSLKFTVWGNRYVQTYAIGGGQADFNVSATTTTSGVSRDSDRDRVQFSAGAAVGVQLNVLPETTPQIGIYAEPGVRYYFDNNSKVETIFKEKPCRFNLQVGVRFGF